MRGERLHWLALACLIVAGIWLVLLCIGIVSAGNLDTPQDALIQAGLSVSANLPAILAAVALTVFITAFFVELYSLVKAESPALTLVALFFIPIFGLLNLAAYISQIDFIVHMDSVAQTAPSIVNAVSRESAGMNTIFANFLAYALLGISSLILGILVIHHGRRQTGRFLMLSGIASIAGLVGLVLQIAAAPWAIIAGTLLLAASMTKLARHIIHPLLQPSSGMRSYRSRSW
jgi:hypothetical protein